MMSEAFCNIVIYADDTTQACDLWQKLELTSELASDLRDTVDWIVLGPLHHLYC